MKTQIIIYIIIAALMTTLSGCYTTFNAPNRIDQNYTDDRVDEIYEDDIYLLASPSIPSMRLNDYSWYYFYDSAWWMDSMDYYPGSDPESNEPRDFRRRHPNYNEGSGSTIGTSTAPVTTPTLGKRSVSEPGSQPEASDNNSDDQRRDFDRRRQTETKDKERDQKKRNKKR